MNSKSSPKARIGAVSYLNTKPLVFGLEEQAPEVEVIFDLPSRLADGLAAGRFDIALIPSIEYFQHPSYSIVSNACIACRGPVWSVKLLSRVPMSGIRTLSLDEGSRTSAALVRILLKQRFNIEPVTRSLAIGADPMEVDTDAVLLIGDRAMRVPGDGFVEVWDLGDEWCRWTKLPFVFAMWVARPGIELDNLIRVLEKSRDSGVNSLATIAAREASALGLTTQDCLGYLRDNLYFFLGPQERRGLELFRTNAVQFGFVENIEPRDSRPKRMKPAVCQKN